MVDIWGFAWFTQGHHTGHTHHKKWFLEPRKGKPEKNNPKTWSEPFSLMYVHARKNPPTQPATYQRCFLNKAWGKKILACDIPKDTNRQVCFVCFLSFLFLSGAFSGQHVIGLEVKQVILFSVVFWRWQWRVVVWGTQRNTQKEIKDTEVLHGDSVRHLFSNPSGPREWHFPGQNATVLRHETACWRLRSVLLCGTSLRRAKGYDPYASASHTVVVELCQTASRGAWCRRRLLISKMTNLPRVEILHSFCCCWPFQSSHRICQRCSWGGGGESSTLSLEKRQT